MTSGHETDRRTAPLRTDMAIDRNDTDERQARLDAAIDQHRAAQQRRLVKQGIALWNRTEAVYQRTLVEPPEKLD